MQRALHTLRIGIATAVLLVSHPAATADTRPFGTAGSQPQMTQQDPLTAPIPPGARPDARAARRTHDDWHPAWQDEWGLSRLLRVLSDAETTSGFERFREIVTFVVRTLSFFFDGRRE